MNGKGNGNFGIGWLWMNCLPMVFFVGSPKQTKICSGKKKLTMV
jgi:hypothetical protein